MKRVQGIGGIFFRAKQPKELQDWYDTHLGISPLKHSPWGEDDTSPLFEWRDKDDPERTCFSVFSVFSESTNYFSTDSDFMFNFRVDDLDAVLEALREEGVQVDDKIEEYSYGRFAWIYDPEGNKIELWEPAEGF